MFIDNLRRARAAKNIKPAAPQIRGVAANQLSERATTKATSGAPINCPAAEACTRPALINVRTDGAADSRGIAAKRELGTKPDTKDNRADAASRRPMGAASANTSGDKSANPTDAVQINTHDATPARCKMPEKKFPPAFSAIKIAVMAAI